MLVPDNWAVPSPGAAPVIRAPGANTSPLPGKRWEKLMIYTTDGKLNIDNNPVENAIRPIAIGRKNYLFAGSHEAAQRSAMLYSLLGTCKLHDVNPFTWMKTILEKLPTHPINKIQELLPHRRASLQ